MLTYLATKARLSIITGDIYRPDLLLITQPISRKSEQICNRSVKTCCQQADIWMRSLALYLSVLTGTQRPVKRSVTSCCDRAAAMLFSTGLSQVVVTELQQC